MAPNTVTVAIINTNPDAIELLADTLRPAGFTVVSALTHELRDGRVNVDAFMGEHNPSVIVFDVAPPYGRTWRFLEQLRDMPIMHERRFVLTSVNARQVEDLAYGDEKVYEVVGKPYDLDQIVQAVREASRARAVRDTDAAARRSREVIPERRHGHDRRDAFTSSDFYRRLTDKHDAIDRERRQAERRHRSDVVAGTATASAGSITRDAGPATHARSRRTHTTSADARRNQN